LFDFEHKKEPLKERIFDKFKDVISFFVDLKYKFIARFIEKTWMVDSGFNRYHYHDISGVLPEVVFKLVVRLVEEEDYFNHVDFEGSGDIWVHARNVVKNAYDFYKVRLPKLKKLDEKMLHRLYGDEIGSCKITFIPQKNGNSLVKFNYKNESRHERRRNLHRKVEELIQLETSYHMVQIVENYSFLWS